MWPRGDASIRATWGKAAGSTHARCTHVAHRITQYCVHLPLKLLLSSVSCTRCGASWAYSWGRPPSSRLLAKRSHLREGERSGWAQCNQQGATCLHAPAAAMLSSRLAMQGVHAGWMTHRPPPVHHSPTPAPHLRPAMPPISGGRVPVKLLCSTCIRQGSGGSVHADGCSLCFHCTGTLELGICAACMQSWSVS